MGRIERRRQLKESEKRLVRGLDAVEPNGRDVVALMRVLYDRTQICIEKRSVRPLMDFFYANIELGERRLANVPVACAAGCSHCCYTYVEASPPEVFYTVGMMDEAQRSEAIETVAAAYARTGGLSIIKRKGVVSPCPLLVDNRCSVYGIRPLVCRTHVSTDVEICHRAYRLFSGEIAPKPVVWQTLRDGYSVSLRGALLRSGLVYTYREWNSSLRIALSDATAEPRWLGGEDSLADATSTGAPSIFTVPSWRKLYETAFGSFP